MSQLNAMELQNLRHLIGGHDNISKKLCSYAEQAQDPQVKQYFEKSSQAAEQTKQKLMSFLQ